MSNVAELLATLERLVEKAPLVPFSQRVLVDGDRVLGCIDEIRRVLPDELAEARQVANERERILLETKNEAEAILMETKERAKKMIEDSAIVTEAKEKASAIVESAQKTSREIRQGAREYADELLAAVEEKMMGIYQQLHRDREQLRGGKAAG